jgi:hypothetical protein
MTPARWPAPPATRGSPRPGRVAASMRRRPVERGAPASVNWATVRPSVCASSSPPAARPGGGGVLVPDWHPGHHDLQLRTLVRRVARAREGCCTDHDRRRGWPTHWCVGRRGARNERDGADEQRRCTQTYGIVETSIVSEQEDRSMRALSRRFRGAYPRSGAPRAAAPPSPAIRRAPKKGDVGIRKIATTLGVGTGMVQRSKPRRCRGNRSPRPELCFLIGIVVCCGPNFRAVRPLRATPSAVPSDTRSVPSRHLRGNFGRRAHQE